MAKGYPVPVAVITLLFIGLIIFVNATSVTEHAKSGDCGNCHLNDPEEKGGKDRLLFTKDITQICSDCHPGSSKLSHPVGSLVKGALPKPFVVDWKGETTCATCHFFHKDANPFFLRTVQAGKNFCLLCHDMSFFRGMVDSGIALQGAHLVKTFEELKALGFIDPLSLECLQCHDGVTAKDVQILLSAGGAVEHLTGATHPIGVSQVEAARRDSGYVPPERLPEQITLIEGNVGCITCHEPYKKVHGALVMSMSGSKLCKACHVK